METVSAQQFVILARTDESAGTGTLAAIGTRPEILRQLAPFNTAPETDDGDVLYGPGITIQLPPDSEPVTQMLMTVTEEEIAWQVITNLLRKLDWKLFDPATGRELSSA